MISETWPRAIFRRPAQPSALSPSGPRPNRPRSDAVSAPRDVNRRRPRESQETLELAPLLPAGQREHERKRVKALPPPHVVGIALAPSSERTQPTQGGQLTTASLRLWASASNQSPKERCERQHLADLILRRARAPRPTTPQHEPIVVCGSLHLENYYELRSLPSGLEVSGRLYLTKMLRLSHLPTNLKTRGLFIDHLPALKRIDVPLRVADDLMFRSCAALQEITARVEVQGDVFLCDLPELRDVSGLRCAKALRLRNCPRVSKWPEKLHLDEFSVVECAALTRLPEGLVVRFLLDVWRCEQLRSIMPHIGLWPSDYSVQPRTIVLRDTGVSSRECTTMRRHLPHTTCDFADFDAEPPVVGRSDDDLTETFDSLADAYDAYGHALLGKYAVPGDHTFVTPLLELPKDEEAVLLETLYRLKETKEFKYSRTQPQFARRVLALLARMAADTDLVEICLKSLAQGNAGCEDRSALALSRTEVAVQIYDAERLPDSTAALRELGVRVMRLDVVYRHAARKVAELSKRCAAEPSGSNFHRDGKEMVEVYLAYEVGLRERLQLPVNTLSMTYDEASKVRESDLILAEQAALAASGDAAQIAAYLASWTPWQIHRRRMLAHSLRFNKLPLAPIDPKLIEDHLCPFTLEPLRALSEPTLVHIHGAWRAYEFASLVTWWIAMGTEPTLRQPLYLDKVYRGRV